MCWLDYDSEVRNHCEDCINEEYCKKLSKETMEAMRKW